MYNNEIGQWIEKYKREHWTMPFGSMCNAYGQMIAGGKTMNLETFKKDMQEIYNLSQKMIKDSLNDEPEQIKKVKEWMQKVGNNSNNADGWDNTKQEAYNEKSELQELSEQK